MPSRSSLLPLCILLYAARDAHAYLDPGTGSYFLQLSIAGLVAAIFSLKAFWGRTKSYYQSLRDKRPAKKRPGDESPP